jgi:mannosyltransferase OCH1-like enzyme
MDYSIYINELSSNITYKNGIPKIIHQVWINDTFLGNPKKDIPNKVKASQQEWSRLHPDWKYMLWTDEYTRDHIEYFRPSYLDLYDNYEYLIQRADMIRYFILYDFGGLYCDIDMYPLKNIEDYITGNMCHFVYSANGDTIINGFMISPKGSSIMKKVQENLLKPLPFFAIGKHFKVLYSSGPAKLNQTILNDIDEPFVIVPRKMFNPYSIVNNKNISENKDQMYISTIVSTSSWNSYDTIAYNFVQRNKTFFIIFGILSILLIIFLLFYYISNYRKCKLQKKCNA